MCVRRVAVTLRCEVVLAYRAEGRLRFGMGWARLGCGFAVECACAVGEEEGRAALRNQLFSRPC